MQHLKFESGTIYPLYHSNQHTTVDQKGFPTHSRGFKRSRELECQSVRATAGRSPPANALRKDSPTFWLESTSL